VQTRTTYSTLTTTELILAVANQQDATELEIELAERLEQLLHEIEDTKDDGK